MEGYEASTSPGLLTGGRYRPFALTLHIIEQELHGNDPFWCHLFNAFLNGLLGIVAFLFFKQLFGFSVSPALGKWAALAGALFYMLHPLHVEAIANIRNRDELLSSLLGMGSVFLFTRYVLHQKLPFLLSGSFILLMALFTKESAINFVPVLLLFLLIFSSPMQLSRKFALRIALSVSLVMAFAFSLRHLATHSPSAEETVPELLNQVYLNADTEQHISGILYVYGLGLKLLFLPYPLTHDYYPYHPFRTFAELERGITPYPGFTEWPVLLSAGALLLLLFLLFFSFFRRHLHFKYRLIAFCISVFFGTTLLYANIFFEIGSFFNERFLFVASLSPALLFGYAVGSLRQRKKLPAYILLLLFSIAFAVVSAMRISDWKDDNHLVLADARVSTGSARANLIAAEASLRLGQRNDRADLHLLQAPFNTFTEQGVFYAERALKIYPTYLAPLDILGNLYFEQGKAAQSFALFSRYYRQNPIPRIWGNLLYVAESELEKGRTNEAGGFYLALSNIANNPNQRAEAYARLGKLKGQQLNQLDSSIFYLNKAVSLNPARASYREDLGTAYAISGKASEAKQALKKAYAIGAANKNLLQNLSLLYRQLGVPDSALYFQNLATEKDR